MTSMRPHGKWGDLIICCIPVTWCINILINSNFLLKMIEWQSENSLFTIRIRGRQWYWVYKFDLKDFTDILSANKNVGHNKIFFSSFGELKIMDNYLHNVNLRASNKFLNKYWNIQLYKHGKNDNYFINSFIDNKFLFNTSRINNSQKVFTVTKAHTSPDYKFLYEDSYPFVFKRKSLFKMFLNMVKPKVSDDYVKIYLKSIIELDLNKCLNYEFNFDKQFKINLLKFNNYYTKINYFDKAFFTKYNIFSIDKNYLMNFYEPLDIFAEKKKIQDNFVIFNIFDESLRWAKRSSGTNGCLRTIKLPLNNYILQEKNFDLFRFRFTDTNTIQHKNIPNTNYFTFKQKRYKFRTKVLPSIRYFRDQKTGNYTNIVKSKTNPVLLNNSIFVNDYKNELSNSLRLIQKNKKHDEFFSISLYRRLLRVRKTLVLPAHVNICAITNSYDVVHSWFIPGLGLKLDCIPGRATHHTFYVDNVGFYYGQCAEICGRYHHHMPIKVCALPFEHFIIWWQSFGLQKLMFTNSQKKYNTYYNFRKFVW